MSLGESPNVNRSTVRMQSPDGRERLVIINTQQIYDEQGALAGAVATVRDITEGIVPRRREIIVESEPMKEVMAFVRRIASSEAVTILLEGESGTGKDLIAKTLHYESTRRAEPFIVINCAAIADTLLESELFGYEKGAFTDARARSAGCSNWPTTALCSSTKSANSPCPCKPSCCGCSKTKVSAASVV